MSCKINVTSTPGVGTCFSVDICTKIKLDRQFINQLKTKTIHRSELSNNGSEISCQPEKQYKYILDGVNNQIKPERKESHSRKFYKVLIVNDQPFILASMKLLFE